MIKSIIWTVVFSFIAAVLRSTLLSNLTLGGAGPDLALIIIVFSAYVNGPMVGQISGFFSGILIDVLSFAPLGLNVFIRTLTGALTGLLKGSFFLDVFLVPMILCACATLFKAFILFMLNLLIPQAIPAYSFLSTVLWAELALNSLAAPFLFGFLKRFRPMIAESKQTGRNR